MIKKILNFFKKNNNNINYYFNNFHIINKKLFVVNKIVTNNLEDIEIIYRNENNTYEPHFENSEQSFTKNNSNVCFCNTAFFQKEDYNYLNFNRLLIYYNQELIFDEELKEYNKGLNFKFYEAYLTGFNVAKFEFNCFYN